MVKAAISPVSTDLQSQKNFTAIREALNGGLDLANLNIRVVEGITSDTPDSEKRFRHGLPQKPQGWFLLLGDVYVEGISVGEIDVRSTKRNVAFRILVVSGLSLTSTDLVQPDDYQDTIDVIGTYATGTGNFLGSTKFSGQAGMRVPHHILAVGDYFYWTQQDTSSANSDQLIHRINTVTGVYESLNPTGIDSYGAMYYDDTSGILYVSEIISTTPITVLKIDTTTFTVSATLSCATGFTLDLVSFIYVDGDGKIYLGGQRTSTSRGVVVKFNADGTLVSAIANATGTASATAGAKKLFEIGDKFYVICTDGSLTADTRVILKITKSTWTLDTTITVTDSEGLGCQSGVEVDGVIYIPFISCTNATIGGTASPTYSSFLLKLDTTSSDLQTIIPYSGYFHDSGGTINSNQTTKSVITYNSKVYWIGCSGSGTELFEYDIATDDITSYILPITHGGTASTSAMDNYLLLDSSGVPTIFADGGTASTNQNTTWFQPDL